MFESIHNSDHHLLDEINKWSLGDVVVETLKQYDTIKRYGFVSSCYWNIDVVLEKSISLENKMFGLLVVCTTPLMTKCLDSGKPQTFDSTV